MFETRRQVLFGLAGTLGYLSAASFPPLAAAQKPIRPTPPSSGLPSATPAQPKSVAPRVISPKDQETLRTNVEQISLLAAQLKKEYHSADANTVLSVSFVKTAEQIQKLAKQVKNIARG